MRLILTQLVRVSPLRLLPAPCSLLPLLAAGSPPAAAPPACAAAPQAPDLRPQPADRLAAARCPRPAVKALTRSPIRTSATPARGSGRDPVAADFRILLVLHRCHVLPRPVIRRCGLALLAGCARLVAAATGSRTRQDRELPCAADMALDIPVDVVHRRAGVRRPRRAAWDSRAQAAAHRHMAGSGGAGSAARKERWRWAGRARPAAGWERRTAADLHGSILLGRWVEKHPDGRGCPRLLRPSFAMKPPPITKITEAARSVHLLQIDGYSATATMSSNDYIGSTWNVDGYEWEVRVYPEYDHKRWGWVALKLIVLSKPRTVDVRKRHEIAPGYLENDSLTVECAITVLGERPEVVFPATPTPIKEDVDVPPSPPSSDLHRHLGDLLESQKGADVTFLLASGARRFPAHKSVLAARSPVFMAEFFGGMEERTSRVVEV
ncbi:hypothetical protein C2845_PM05G29270 [Panicum miliaceum]|uniref:BTB domain-containing protein n=1 Tax=Panicum miliaceum TaxID=4540 RepID=A0A3L6SXZ7_PANMI|nr:hypothetical protein C2845_PM05G29270 [Panicum miliaceum]